MFISQNTKISHFSFPNDLGCPAAPASGPVPGPVPCHHQAIAGSQFGDKTSLVLSPPSPMPAGKQQGGWFVIIKKKSRGY